MNIVITGLSWAGRERLASVLAERVGARFIDGRTLHPPANRAKLSRGAPLTPTDQAAWLDAIGLKIVLRGQGTIITCPALRVADRSRIREAAQGDLTLVQVTGSLRTVTARMAAGGDLPSDTMACVTSQIQRLETAEPDENVLTLDLLMPRERMIDAILEAEAERMRRAARILTGAVSPNRGASPDA